ncbi:Penicillin-binding protein 1F [compost metagenome]
MFANGGEYNAPYSIKSIVDHDGVERYKHNPPKAKKVLSEQTAYYMTEMLQNVVNDGTGKRAKISRPVAGKTGTTQHGIKGLNSKKNRDVWFVGYTPEWSAAIWMGYDKPDKDHLLNGSSGQTASLFAAIMEEALKGVPVKDFPVPDNLQKQEPEPEETVEAPKDLSASYSEDTGVVSLSWTGVSQSDVVYRIYRKDNTQTEFSHNMDSVATSIDDIGVVEGTGYEYYVTAYDPVNNTESEPTNTAQVLIVADEPPMDEIDPGQNGDGNGLPSGTDNGTGSDGTTPPSSEQGTLPGNNGNGQSGNGSPGDSGGHGTGTGTGTGGPSSGDSGGGNSSGNGDTSTPPDNGSSPDSGVPDTPAGTDGTGASTDGL